MTLQPQKGDQSCCHVFGLIFENMAFEVTAMLGQHPKHLEFSQPAKIVTPVSYYAIYACLQLASFHDY